MTTSPDPASAPADDERRPAGVVERRLTALHDALSPIREACHRPAVALAFAAGLIVVAALLRVALGDNTPRFVTFYPAVALAALIGGPIAGITATLASLAGALVLMWAKVWIPNGSLHLDIVSFGNFTLTGLLMSLIAAADLGALRRDRGRTAAAVDASETHHRTILAALHEGVLVFTRGAGLTYANPSAQRILGADFDELRRRDAEIDWGLLDADGRPLAREEYPAVRVMRDGLPFEDEVLGTRRGDGSVVWTLVAGRPIRAADGVTTASVVSFVDVDERLRVERELAESRARFASIVETALDAIVSVDATGGIVLFNAAAERMFGWTADEIVGRPLELLIPPEHRATHAAGFASFVEYETRTRKMGRGGRIEALRRDGTVFPIEASISRVEVAGKPLFTVVHRDVTERRDAEIAGARLAAIVEFASAAIFTVGTDRRVETWSAGATRLFGHAAEAIVGRVTDVLVPETERAAVRTTFARVMAGETVQDEGQRLRVDGTPIDVSWTAAPIRDPAGSVAGVVVIMTDVRERRRRERELSERQVELRQTLDAAGLGVWWIDVASGRVHGDPRSLLLLGVPDGAALALLAERFHREDRDAFLGLPRALGSGTDRRALTLRTEGPDGRIAWLHLTARLRRTERADEEIWGTVQDVSERRLAEQALRQVETNRRLEALGRMTGGIAHDFNNLLTIISGNLQLIDMAAETDEIRRWVAEALRATETGAALNNRLTTFARRRRLVAVVTDLDARIDAMLDLLRRSVGPAITVVARFAPEPALVRIDPAEIENTLLNLAFNARDAMPDGGRLVIETEIVSLAVPTGGDLPSRSGPWVRLSVSDTGHGMSPEVQARAFEPFFTTKETGRGSGLGLATLHGFVTQSGGFVNLYSELGHGTTVNVYLPRAEADEDATAHRLPDAPTAPPRGRGETILLVEDDEGVARVTRERLTTFGWRVEVVGDAEAALARLADGPPIDLVFTDVVMPGPISGLDLARRLRAADPTRRILLTSGFSEEISRGNSPVPLEFPMLRKPYALDDLLAAVTTALASPQPRDTSQVKT